MSWPLVKLDSVVEVLSGFAFKSSCFNKTSQGVPIIRIQNVAENNSEEDFVYWDESYKEKFLIDDGDILLSLSGNIKLGIWGNGKALLNQRIIKISEKEGLDKGYLFYFLMSAVKSIAALGKEAVISNVSVNDFKALQIPLPPLETQKQIATVLEKADQLRKDCQQMEQELNSLAQSVFIDMFGSKAPGYSEWPLHHIEELAESKKGSMRTGPFGSDLKHSEFVDEGIAVIGIDNAVKNEFAWGERRFITPEKYEKLKRYRVYPQDLIITIMGTTGRIAVIPNDIPLSISTKHLAVITLDKEKVLPEFLAIAIKTHPDLLHQILDSNKGAIMDGLNLGLIKALSLKLPPLDLQSEYLAVLKVIQEQVFESRSSLKQHNDLFNALMQKAFKGELNL